MRGVPEAHCSTLQILQQDIIGLIRRVQMFAQVMLPNLLVVRDQGGRYRDADPTHDIARHGK